MTHEPISQEEIDALLRGMGLGGAQGPDRWQGLREPLADALAAAWSLAPAVLGGPVEAGPVELKEESPASLAAGLGEGSLWGRIPVGEAEAWVLISDPLAQALLQQAFGGQAPAGAAEGDGAGAGASALQEILSQLLSRGLQRLLEATGVQEPLGGLTVGGPGPGEETALVACRQEVRLGSGAGGTLALALPVALAERLLAGTGARGGAPTPAAGGAGAAPATGVTSPAGPTPTTGAGTAAPVGAGAAAPAGAGTGSAAGGSTAPAAGPAPTAGTGISYRPVQFEELDPPAGEPPKVDARNLDLLLDVTLQVTVELGRTHRQIRDVLALAPGSVLELEKLAGEPVDVLVNGKLIARGEVVVIDEHFGVRITDIISPAERAASLGR
ncbi:MAG: flagellar motor switch protein FliN [Firmicutes bacterium]|nr:flagellar motor switch protein FliN [Bacillota bacterium]